MERWGNDHRQAGRAPGATHDVYTSDRQWTSERTQSRVVLYQPTELWRERNSQGRQAEEGKAGSHVIDRTRPGNQREKEKEREKPRETIRERERERERSARSLECLIRALAVTAVGIVRAYLLYAIPPGYEILSTCLDLIVICLSALDCDDRYRGSKTDATEML